MDTNVLYVDAVNNRIGINNSAPAVGLHLDGDQIIDNTSVEAFLVRKNGDGGDLVSIDTSTNKVNIYGINGASVPTLDLWANNMLVGSDYGTYTRQVLDQWGNPVYKNFSLKMAGQDITTKTNWSMIDAQTNPISGQNALQIGGSSNRGPTQILFRVASSQSATPATKASIEYNGAFAVGDISKFFPSGSFAAIDGAGFYIFDDATLGSEMITTAANRTLDAGYNWTFTGGWSRQATGGNPGACIYHNSLTSSTGKATLAAANLTVPLKANKWYKLQVDMNVDDWNAFGFYIDTQTSAEWTQFAHDGAWVTKYMFFRPISDGVNLVLGWKVSGKSDIVEIDNISLKEMQAGDASIGGIYYGNGLTLNDGGVIKPVSNTTGLYLGSASTDKLGFWGNTPVVQHSTTGQTTGFTVGAGGAVDDAATFTGGVGSTAYTIGDIVKALKNAGIMAE